MTAGKQMWRNRKEKKEWARRLQSEDPGLRGSSSSRRRDRCGEQHALRRRAAGPRSRTSTPIRVFYGGLASSSRLATELWSKDSSHAVDWRLLDSAVRDSGRTWPRGLSGQCAAHQEPARTQERRAGEPVVAEVAHLWATEQLLPTTSRDPSATNLLATTGRTRSGAATCIQRMQKALTQMNVQLANVISDISGLTGQAIIRAIVAGERNPLKLAKLSSSADPRQPRRNRQKPGGQLATGTAVRAASGSRHVRHLSETNR